MNNHKSLTIKRLRRNTPKPKAKSREYFIRLARENANISGWYDESVLEKIGRAIDASYSYEPHESE